MPMWRQIEGELREKLSTDLNNSRLNSSGPKLPSQFSQPEEGAETGIVLGHPKLERLREMVLEHFRTKESEGVATRVMIFSQYRDSVQEITACLHAHRPLVKVMQFVGQAGTKGGKI
jgi:ERCC4-related helicase